jgi:hypothetical protein
VFRLTKRVLFWNYFLLESTRHQTWGGGGNESVLDVYYFDALYVLPSAFSGVFLGVNALPLECVFFLSFCVLIITTTTLKPWTNLLDYR